MALKITGQHLRGFKPAAVAGGAPVIEPDASGVLILSAEGAELQGLQIKVEEKEGKSNIGFWDRPEDTASWKVKFKAAGKYKVSASCAAIADDALAIVEVAGKTIDVKPAATGGWDRFSEFEAGTIEITQAGEQVVKIRARDAQSWKAINLRWLKLSPIRS